MNHLLLGPSMGWIMTLEITDIWVTGRLMLSLNLDIWAQKWTERQAYLACNMTFNLKD